MSASEHLNGQQFFHASKHEFSPGDMIEPGHSPQHVYTHGQESGQHVYAAHTADVAGHFGRHVYQVEPTGAHEPDPEDVWSMGMVRSTQPMRVVGKTR